MDNEFEKKLDIIFKEKIYKTEIYYDKFNKLLNSLENNENNNKNKKFKLAFSTCVVSLLISTVVIGATILKNNFQNSTKGVSTAIENGYTYQIENINYIEKNGVMVGVKEIVMDDYQLNILFDVKFPGIKEEIDSIYLKNTMITDENDNILFAELESERYKQICNQRNVESLYNIEKSYIGGGYFRPQTIISDKCIQESIQISNIIEKPFPKSKQLNISFSSIVLKNRKNDTTAKFDSMADFLSKGKVKEIENSWNINIKLPEIMYDRKSEEYVLDKSNIKNFNIEEATLSNTKLAIKLNIRAEELLCNKDDSKEIIDKKINDYYYNNTGIRMYKEIYIENKLGDKFYLESNNDGSGISTNNGYDLNFTGFFEITKFDKNDEKLKLIFVRDDDKKVEIELKKL